MIPDALKDKQVILFDGVCNLCNSSVLFVIKRDKKNKFLFTALREEFGQKIIKKFEIDTTKIDSILLYKNGEIFYKSTAALMVAKNLGFPYNLGIIFFIIPPFIRNYVYDFIARNRYKWFGKKESCMIPTPELKSRFL